jgi:hypothetical protein
MPAATPPPLHTHTHTHTHSSSKDYRTHESAERLGRTRPAAARHQRRRSELVDVLVKGSVRRAREAMELCREGLAVGGGWCGDRAVKLVGVLTSDAVNSALMR